MNDFSRQFLEELASLPTFTHVAASPNGDKVALYYDITGRNELHVLDLESETIEQWSDGEISRTTQCGIKWSTDRKWVYFHQDTEGDEQYDIQAINRNGTIETIVDMNGQTVLADVGCHDETLLFYSTVDKRRNLYAYNLNSDKVSKLTDCNHAITNAELSSDGSHIAYSTNKTDDIKNQDVYVALADGSDSRNLDISKTGIEASPADWSPDSDRLLISDYSEDIQRCGVYDLEAESIRWYGSLEYKESPVCFLPCGKRFLSLRVKNCTIMPLVYNCETGASIEPDLPDGVATFVKNSVINSDRVLIIHTSPTERPELLELDLSTGRRRTLINATYGSINSECFADAEHIIFESDGVPKTTAAAVNHDSYDSLKIEALLFDSGQRPSPLVVNPHGGPRTSDYKLFKPHVQLLNMLGYSVLQVNYRGSTGRGQKFMKQLYQDWGGAEQGDIAVGVEHVLANYDWLNKDQVVVVGGSFGGYSTYWQLLQYPNLYSAGIAWSGITDLSGMYKETMPHLRTELLELYLGIPESNSELYAERSPITHVENLSSPVKIVHAVNDHRIPIEQARIFRNYLEEAGFQEGKDADFEYTELERRGHASSGIEVKREMYNEFTDFLERRIESEPKLADE